MDPSVSCIREVNMQQSILVAEVVLLLLSIIVLFFVVDEYQTCNESTVLPLRNTNMLQTTSIGKYLLKNYAKLYEYLYIEYGR